MPNQHPRRGRSIRFTDAEWAELQRGAEAIGETRSEAIRAGSLSRVRQAIPNASDVTRGDWTVVSANDWKADNPQWLDATALPPGAQLGSPPSLVDFDGTVRPPVTHVFACAYCPAEFCTSFDAEAHIDTMHPGREES